MKEEVEVTQTPQTPQAGPWGRITFMTDLNVKRWARMGAEVRLAELRQEITAILAAFPVLRQGGGGQAVRAARKRAGEAASRGGAPRAAKTRKRRRMSAEARKKISAAQKARWAKQKAEAKKTAVGRSHK